ncbi:hypothetical protein [Shewanella psychrotolerans]|uniref:hypothetical protein n=1 Tax=Shewanella psychrotolerans TaxID=2864206 RepID=UPI001C655D56|nr:hypothetical protein [Shewanella psychrotolerans]QYK03157.1 hypothetical protein K0I62_09655 [Shewanella psychrotolerans]
MKELSIHEQDSIIGGGSGALSGAIGAGLGEAAFGDGSPGCAALGSVVGSGVTVAMGMTPMGGVAGAFVSTGVASACNNRPGYSGSSGGSAGGSFGGSAGYWPSSGGSTGGGGGGSNKFQFLMCMAEE